jgi:hypothetical protein
MDDAIAFQSNPSHRLKTSGFFGCVNGGILPDNNHASATSGNLEIPALLYFLVFTMIPGRYLYRRLLKKVKTQSIFMLCNTLRPNGSQNNMPSASGQECPQFSELSSPRALSYTKLGISSPRALSCGNSSFIFSVMKLSIIDSSGAFGLHP